MSLPLRFCNFVADAVDYGINSGINFPCKRFAFCNLVRRENRPNAIGDSIPLDREIGFELRDTVGLGPNCRLIHRSRVKFDFPASPSLQARLI